MFLNCLFTTNFICFVFLINGLLCFCDYNKFKKMMNENEINSQCFICNVTLYNPQYNISTTITNHSKVILLDFIQLISNSKIITTESDSICDECYVTVNELDYVETQGPILRKKLLDYLNGCIKPDADEKNVVLLVFNCEHCDASCVSQDDLEVHRLNCMSNECDYSDAMKKDKSLQQTNLLQESNNEITVLQDIVINEVDVSCQQEQKENNKSLMVSVEQHGKKKQKAVTKKEHKCDQCNKIWKTLSQLKLHMASHNKSRPFICEICGQAYKHKSALDIHIGMHNGIYPFTCEYCNKSFTQKGALQRHLPIHTGECPYQCDQCGKRFLHHTSFIIHNLIHTGKKDYKCSLCGIALISASHLKRHMRAHTGEKNFECATCGKKFAEKYNLVSHQKLHNNGNVLKGVKTKK